MYHGRVVPGFPQHPHRGFETGTIVRRGFIDHSDSLGATARFGQGDVQWLTAGGGIVHSEMFPLLEQDKPNPLELFQIWLNLPGSDKLVEPHFSMLWDDELPRVRELDERGRVAEVTLIAGALGARRPPPPPPHSWAARSDTDVAIWTIRLEPGATFRLPRAAGAETLRTLYFFRGDSLAIGDDRLEPRVLAVVDPSEDVRLEAGAETSEILLLQGRPIAEPVTQYGPFVMNTKAEIERAVSDYQRTRFGGWPFPNDAPVHARDAGRFAKHADGRVEYKER
jgi:redox-sensitive bicupin YhaK (pirin superfamily)